MTLILSTQASQKVNMKTRLDDQSKNNESFAETVILFVFYKI